MAETDAAIAQEQVNTTNETIAVVAVHGVGKHEAGASAHAMADLLVGLNGFEKAEGSPYSQFTEHNIEIPLPGAAFFREQNTKEKRGLWKALRTMFEERRGFFEDSFTLQNWSKSKKKKIEETDLGNEFMATQVSEYEGEQERSSYSTCRLEGRRTSDSCSPEKKVHIYELHWSDLGKPSSSVLRFFLSFYQLLLHLASLGRTAIDCLALEHIGSLYWLLVQRTYNYATRVLTLGIFVLLLFLPVVAFCPLPLLLPKTRLAALIAVIGLAIIILGLFLISSQFFKLWPAKRHWLAHICIPILLGGAVSYFLFSAPESTRNHRAFVLLMIEWWFVAYLVVGFFLKKYDEVRNGALQIGLLYMGLVAGGFFYLCKGHTDLVGLSTAAFKMIQYIFIALRLGWILLVALVLVFLLLEFCSILVKQTVDQRARARAAFRTGRFALAVPSLLILLSTIFAWSGIYGFTVKHVSLFDGVKVDDAYVGKGNPNSLLLLSPTETDSIIGKPGGSDQYRFLEGLLFQSAPPGLPLVLAASFVSLLLLLLIVGASVLYEVSPPLAATNRRSKLLGEWLSGGLASFRWVIVCFWLAAFGIPIIYCLLATFDWWRSGASTGYLASIYVWNGAGASAHRILIHGGALIAGSAVLLVGTLVKGLSSALDIILDVDNYLRTSPVNATPRARIIERYLALLHHLHAAGYKRIIVVAHSLGSVISADLFRFLKAEKIPAFTAYAYPEQSRHQRQIEFFTMGSPLRQLLNRFFPHLYKWVRPIPDDAGEPPAIAVVVPQHPAKRGEPIIPKPVPPTVQDLGVNTWANYYRSGDYVGRSVWLDDWYSRTSGQSDDGSFPLAPTSECVDATPPDRLESCIGLGAHTHYWDRTAPDIASGLDRLITAASTNQILYKPKAVAAGEGR